MATVNMSYPRSIRLTIKSKVPSNKPMPEGSWTSKRSINEENETSQPTKKLRIVPPREKVSFKDHFKGPFMATLKLPSQVLQAEAEQAPHRKQRRDLINQGWRNLSMRIYYWRKGRRWQVFFLFSLLVSLPDISLLFEISISPFRTPISIQVTTKTSKSQ